MLITTQVVDKIIDKLNMYKLASDVNVALDDNMSIYSTINDVKINAFDKNENFQIKYEDDFIILNNCHGQLLHTYMLLLKKTKVLKSIENYQRSDFSIIRLVDMLKGIHHLNSYTFEKFIPQNLNMSAEMGINFKKDAILVKKLLLGHIT